MKQQTDRHRYTPVRRGTKGGFYHDKKKAVSRDYEYMYDGLQYGIDMARKEGCDIYHEVFNDYLRKWDYLGTFHPDGTCTSWTGERLVWLGKGRCGGSYWMSAEDMPE